MNKQSFRRLSLATAISTMLLSGCSSWFLGKENLSEPVDLPTNPNAVSFTRQWQHSVGDGTAKQALKIQPLIIGNAIITASADGELVAFSKAGNRLWQRDIGHNIATGVAGNSDTVIIATEEGLLMAFATQDGKSRWQKALGSEVLAAPIVKNGLVVARAIDGQVVALSEKSGAVKWKQTISTAELSIRGNSRPLLFNDVVLMTTSKGRLVLLSLNDGEILQDLTVAYGTGLTPIDRIADLLATPTVQGNTLYVSAYRQNTLAIDLNTGKPLWESPIATALDLFADRHHLYVVDKNSIIHALDLKTGRSVWTSNALEGRRISPIAGDGNYIVTVDNTGKLIALTSRHGKIMGYTDVGSKRTYIAPQWLDGKWLTYTSDGDLTLTQNNAK